MIRALDLILVGLLAGSATAAEAKKSLREYAATLQGRHAYGVYVRGQKAGWMTLDVKLGKHDGKDALICKEEMRTDLKRGEDTLKMEEKTLGVYSLEGDGDLLLFEERTIEDGRESLWRGERKGDGFLITSSTTKRGRTVKPPRRNVLATRKLDEWLRSGPNKGASLDTYQITLSDPDIDTRETNVYQGKKSLTVGGVTKDVYLVRVRSKGAISDMEVFADGTPLRGTLAGILEMRSEPEETAKKFTAPQVDLLELASIPSDRDLGNPDQVAGLVLEVTGLDDYPLPVTHRQQLRAGEAKGTHLLTLKRDFQVEKPHALTAAQKKEMLEATPTVQSDEAKVKAQAAQIVGDETDVHKKAQKLSRWVYRKVRKSFNDNSTTTLEVMERMAGDCTEHSLLFVSLARAAGIPAREVGGVGYAGAGSKSFGWHAWAEYHDGHQWVSIDPTWNQDRIDATHVKFSDSADDLTWVNLLGKVKFKVREVTK